MVSCSSKPMCNAFCHPRLGRLNVKQEEIDEMLKEAPGPVNFTVFLTMFGEKLKGEGGEGRVCVCVGGGVFRKALRTWQLFMESELLLFYL